MSTPGNMPSLKKNLLLQLYRLAYFFTAFKILCPLVSIATNPHQRRLSLLQMETTENHRDQKWWRSQTQELIYPASMTLRTSWKMVLRDC